MAVPYNAEAISNYSLANDKDEPKSIFHLGFLDASESAYLDEQFSKVELKGVGDTMQPEIKIDISGKQLEAVRLKLKGAENFGSVKFDTVEKQYPFGKRNVLSNKALDTVKPFIAELGQQIISQSSLSEAQEKN
jgi:hypothetical protein